ncbi:HNH endonuclease signature motif containing protein [Micromonospora costi]|uniref:HNH endonuclease n=1 Tax=Micromonospora costi TaxID=1530042 RepID=UPI0033F58EE6
MATRAAMPSHYEIALWWLENQDRDARPFVLDLGEPACFACRWYPDGCEASDTVTLKASWALRAKLERAHLKPHSLGGTNDPSNIVLLCRVCHLDAPDWEDAAEMLGWVRRRRHWSDLAADKLRAAWNETRPGVPIPNVDEEAVRSLIREQAGVHFGVRMKASTFAVAIARAAGI